jgi:hypothetical protein
MDQFSAAGGFLYGPRRDMDPHMSLRCFFGRHRPMLTSIVRRDCGYTALCDDCGLPIVRAEDSRWAAAVPLVTRHDQAA